jgi:hypothetical protein
MSEKRSQTRRLEAPKRAELRPLITFPPDVYTPSPKPTIPFHEWSPDLQGD